MAEKFALGGGSVEVPRSLKKKPINKQKCKCKYEEVETNFSVQVYPTMFFATDFGMSSNATDPSLPLSNSLYPLETGHDSERTAIR